MPGFLDILGGLATSGAQGATGAATGAVEGEGLRRKFQSEDILNSLHVLQQLSAQQDLEIKRRLATQPKYEFHNGQMIAIPPTGGPPVLTPMPQVPLNPLQQSQAAAAEARAKWDAARTDQAGKPKPIQYDAKTQGALNEWRANPSNQGKSLMDFWREFSSVQRAPERPLIVAPNASVIPPGATAPSFTAPSAPVSRIENVVDAQGYVHPTANTIWPSSGKFDTVTRNIGPLGKPAASTKEPTNFDALTAKANDSTVPQADRDRAKTQADAIQAAHVARTQAGVTIHEQVKLAQEARKEALKNQTADEKRVSTLNDLQRMRELAKQIQADGLLPPSGTTSIGMWIANKKRAWLDPSNDALVSFRGLFGPVLIGQVDRGVFDEKGVRAIQAFKANFDMIDKMPSYSAMDRFLSEVEGSIRSKMRTDPGAGGAGPPDEIHRSMRSLSGATTPADTTSSPPPLVAPLPTKPDDSQKSLLNPDDPRLKELRALRAVTDYPATPSPQLYSMKARVEELETQLALEALELRKAKTRNGATAPGQATAMPSPGWGKAQVVR